MRKLNRQWRLVTTGVLAAAAVFHLWFVGIVGTMPERLLNSAHLAFLLPVAFLLYPASATRSPRSRPSLLDGVLIALTLVVTLYVAINQPYLDERIESVSRVTNTQVVFGTLALLVLLEATRRVIGLGMAIVLAIAMLYLTCGSQLPGQLGFQTISYRRCIEIMYLGGDGGMFGQLTGISAGELILFILFGAFLTRTGIGDWFAEVSAAIAGTWTGGAAKIAVIYSGLFGGVSGSPTADLYATGVYTIPLMKRSGFDASYAAGLAAASAVGSQIMPPLMGASVFIMAALLGRSFASIAAVAIIPALLFFLAKGAAAHYQAKRDGVGALPASEIPPLRQTLKGAYYVLPIVVLIGSLYAGFSPVRCALYGLFAAFLISFTKPSTRQTPRRVIDTLAKGAGATIVVAVPCAAAGVIVSMLTQTGLGLAFSTIIAGIAHGSVVLALVLAAIAALILGIGVPTTPAYILTAAVAAPALTRLGIDPLAANMFVLYFAVLSNIHPPVGITSYAAAGIADAPPMRTGMQALKIAVPGFVIPFAFAYHPALLFQGDITDFPLTAALTTASVMGIAAGLAGYLLAPLRVTERVILVLGSFLLVGRSPWIIGFGALCVLAIWAKQALQRRRALADVAADPVPQVGHRRWQPVVVGAPAASFRDNAAATTAPRATTPSRLDANEELSP